MTRRDEWTYVCGLVAVAETRLMTDEALEDLSRAAGLSAGAAQAGDNGRLRQELRQIETYRALGDESEGDLKVGLEAALVRALRALGRDCPRPDAAEAFTLAYDYQRLRRFARARLTASREAPVTVAPSAFATWDDQTLTQGWERLVDGLPEIGAAAEAVEAALAGADEPQRAADLVLDRMELTAFQRAAASLESDLIDQWAREHVLLRAGLAVARARLGGDHAADLRRHFLVGPLRDDWLVALLDLPEMDLIPALAERVGGAEEGLDRLAVRADDRLTELLAPARYVAFGPERVLGYAWGLTVENVNLRLIAQAAATGLSAEALKPRLRRSYG